MIKRYIDRKCGNGAVTSQTVPWINLNRWRPTIRGLPGATVAIVGLACASLPWLAGCGGSQPDKMFDVRELQGKVDTTLPASAQERQEALRRLLNGLQEGAGDKAALAIYAPGIDFRESFPAFFDGHKRLVRWDFVGKPNRDEIAVSLFFDDIDSGPVDPKQLRQSDRTYVVSTTAGRRFAISRK